MDQVKTFSDNLEAWLKSRQPKTIAGLIKVFGERSFAVALFLLMFIPALPLPTGGVTHVLEIIAILLALEMALGRRTIWIPRRWQNTSLKSLSKGKALTSIIKWLRWLEKYSRPRLRGLLKNRLFLMFTGLAVAVFCLAALLAPPFSGLDTLPSLAVVLIALSMIFEDILVYIIGLIVGLAGISTVIVLGTAIFKSFKLWF